MSKEVLISVNKEHLDNILDGIKKIEWRKKPLPLGKHYGYETKNKGGCGKVTGEFEVVENIKFNLHGDTYRPQWLAKGCVSYKFLVEYANGAEYLYANIIENAKRYDKPKELREFRKYCGKVEYFEVESVEFFEYCYNCPNLVETDSGLCSVDCGNRITRPPQSWQFVERLGE